MTAQAGARGSAHLLSEPEAVALLAEYGIAYPGHRLVMTTEAAVEAAAELGYPVVIKIVSPDVAHKSDAGGVITGVASADAVRDAVHRVTSSVIAALPAARIDGYLVCEQVRGGHEIIIGGLRDATFGATVMFGLGGVFTEVFKDVTFRVAPLSAADAKEMLGETRGSAVLRGARGGVVADEDALVAALLGVSRLMVEREDIAELDLNPVLAGAASAMALDARVIIEGAEAS
jgi:acetyl-CoA synthetase (ADP-forming)